MEPSRAVSGPSVEREERVPSCSLDRPDLVEGRFGVLGCELIGEVRRCTAETATWASDVPGVEQAGALAVFVDHLLGEVGNHPQPAGSLPLTTHLSVDILCPPPWGATGPIRATARRVREDARASFSRADVTDSSGRFIAAAGAWTTYVPSNGAPPLATGRPARRRAPAESRKVTELLGVTVRSDGINATSSPLPTAQWSNQYGSLHGGVWACSAELLASRLLSEGERPLRTTHFEITFLRAGRTAHVDVRAQLVRRGRTLGLVEVEGVDEDGRLCVRASVIGQA